MNDLKDMETSSLLLMTRSGDSSAFAELVSRYTPMLNALVSRFASSALDSGELFSEACFALYRAAMTYDISRTAVTFGLYARTCVRNRIYDLVGKAEHSEAIVDCDVDSLGISPGAESALLKRESLREIHLAAQTFLSEYEYQVFVLYLRGYTTAEMAMELGKSAKSIDNAKLRMLKHLRENSDRFSEF